MPIRPDPTDSQGSSFAASRAKESERTLVIAECLLRVDVQTHRVLLDHISLSLNENQRIALIGPSGSGKSLLLRSLARLDPLDGGRLTWKGQPVADQDVPRFRSQVCYLAQQTQFPAGTVESVLRAPFRFRIHRSGTKQFDSKKIMHWLAEAGRDESFLRQPVDQLSGGERQLLAILRAIQLEPAVLLLDEPTAALDQQTTRIAERWILQWHRSDTARAFIWATHDTEQPQRVADVVLSMSDGRWCNAPTRIEPHAATDPVADFSSPSPPQ